MNRVVAVCKCINIRCLGRNQAKLWRYWFGFCGVYLGESIRLIEISLKRKLEINKGEEYILYLSHSRADEGILKANLLSIKKLDNSVISS